MTQRSVLITGAAGFLGQHFLAHHLGAGDRVYACDDFSNAVQTDDSVITAMDAESFLMSMGEVRVDLAYHFAAPVGGRIKIEQDPLFNADSLRLDSAFFRWAINHATTVVYPSSSAVYGVKYQTDGQNTALSEPMFDPADVSWSAPDEMYGFTKMAGEVLAFKAAKYGLNTLCIRPFSGYGEGQSLQYPVPSICQRALDRENPLVVWGAGTQARDFIHVSDLVAGVVAAVNHGVFGYETLNLGSGVPTSFISVARLAAEIVGYSPIIDTDGSKPQGVANRFADTTRMRRIYQPKISLKDGLTRVLEDLARAQNRIA